MLGFVLISALLILADFVSKNLVYVLLAGGREISLITGILRLIYVENRGAAFGILQGNSFLLISIALFVAIFLFFYVSRDKCKDNWQYIGVIFLFAGTVGNLIDRMFLGYVIDFIDLPYWPTFNFADIFINIGVALLLISFWREKK